jgi:hypothetical protein
MSDTMDYLKCETCGRPAHEKGWTHSTCRPNWPANPRPPLEPTTAQDKPLWPKWCEEGDHPYFAISNGPTEYKCIICHLYEENDHAESALAAMREDRDLWQEAHDEDCPNKASLETMREERDRAQDALREADELLTMFVGPKYQEVWADKFAIIRAALRPVSPSSQPQTPPPEGVPQ